jgi:hypothetical protein
MKEMSRKILNGADIRRIIMEVVNDNRKDTDKFDKEKKKDEQEVGGVIERINSSVSKVLEYCKAKGFICTQVGPNGTRLSVQKGPAGNEGQLFIVYDSETGDMSYDIAGTSGKMKDDSPEEIDKVLGKIEAS